MKKAGMLLLVLLVLAFASITRADSIDTLNGETLIPFETLDMTVFFLPVADNSPDLLNLGVFDPNQLEWAGTMGFTFPSDPYILSDGQMTFIPGSYEQGELAITDPGEMDEFSLYGGVYTFSLPTMITPAPDGVDNFLWEYNVPVTISETPEPSTRLLLTLGLLFMLGATTLFRKRVLLV